MANFVVWESTIGIMDGGRCKDAMCEFSAVEWNVVSLILSLAQSESKLDIPCFQPMFSDLLIDTTQYEWY